MSRLSATQQKKYLGKLRGAERAAREAEILYRREHRSDEPFVTDEGQPTKRSKHAAAFERKYGRAPKDTADAARLSGVPKKTLDEVYARGMAAWQTGHRPGASQHAWAMARVESFLTGGPTSKTADADLAREVMVRNPADQTQTLAFKRWFGNSKVVDARGKPLVVYHGTKTGGFTVYDKAKLDPWHHGFFFTDSIHMAASYSRGNQADPLARRHFDNWEQLRAALVDNGNMLDYGTVTVYLQTYVSKIPKVLEPFLPALLQKVPLPRQGIATAFAMSGLLSPQAGLQQLAESTTTGTKARPVVIKLMAIGGFPDDDKLTEELVNETELSEFVTVWPMDGSVQNYFKLNDPWLLHDVNEAAAKQKVEGIYQAFLSFQNPLEVDAGGAEWSEIPAALVMGSLDPDEQATVLAQPEEFRRKLVTALGVTTDGVCAIAKLLGYDSTIIRNCLDYGNADPNGFPADIFVAFSPTQIKSANHNKGTFDPHDPDIRNPADQTHIPPGPVAAAARRGLELRASQPASNRCCTSVGLRRASQLANRQPVSEDTMRRMLSYFQRHEVDKQGKDWSKGTSKGLQAWLCWGGDEGYAWVRRVLGV